MELVHILCDFPPHPPHPQATPPDGHVAPVQDLLGSASVGIQTPPSLALGAVTLQSSQPGVGPSSPFPGTSSPFPLPSSPSATHTTTHTAATSDSTHSGIKGMAYWGGAQDYVASVYKCVCVCLYYVIVLYLLMPSISLPPTNLLSL